MMLSILIPTLTSRKKQFDVLTQKLKNQIVSHGLERQVEILDFPDNGEQSVGYKRNRLIEMARGKFVVFIDDDDDVSADYVPSICETIKENVDIDCIGIKGTITFSGKKPRNFIHSLKYRDYFSTNGTYYRPPYHLNPIRREIASQYKFEEIDYSEDIDWAMRICRDRVLKKEYFIDRVIYYYYCRRAWVYQLLIDKTEKMRHKLCLRLANRLEIKRKLKAALSGKLNGLHKNTNETK